jgi:hypothetical protein
MTRHYRYVGPAEIRKAMEGAPPGVVVRTLSDLEAFIDRPETRRTSDGLVPLTFVVGTDGELRVADRHSEHVACAGGGDVLAAGELFVARGGDRVVASNRPLVIHKASNQSTGYCPEPDSWPALAAALDRAKIPHPGRFTEEITFRLCPRCRERNIVKENWLVCALCDAALPTEWNF